MAKPEKKRNATASGVMTFLSNISYFKFDRALLQKIQRLAKLVIPPENDEVRVEFQVPRHVKNYVELYDDDDFKTMIRSAKKCKDPTVNIAVSLMQDDEKTKDANDEKEEAAKKKKNKKSKIPSENDISPANAEINQKIAALRTKYTCHGNHGSDFCWVSGEEKEHIPLGHPHFNMWAAAWSQGACDDNNPPNHHIFKSKKKDNTNQLAPPTLLQRRIAGNQIAAAQSTVPVINNNFTIPDAFLDLIRPSQPTAPAAAPATAAPPPLIQPLHEQVMLLPPNTKVGEPITITQFCVQYDLDDSIATKLASNGYRKATSFNFMQLKDLAAMQFLPGEIAELRDAIQQWAVPT
ncbi:hypothetical protein B0H19DRAFT_1060163 [Mycena capillaripes]|nr:hypothetical protein B0H19DRAFT_1060163 [Mycena capillaripes]